MSRIQNYLIVAIFTVIAASCVSKEIRSGNRVKLMPNENAESIFDLFCDKDWIQLSDSVTDALVPYPARIVAADSRYYILDLYTEKNVKVFTSSGEYLHSVGTPGNGPGEYNNIVDFAINDTDREIVILSEPSIANIYDIEGNYIRSKKLDDASLHHIVHTDCGYVATTDYATYPDGEKNCLIYVFDNNLELKSKDIIVKKYMSQIPVPSCALKSLGNKALYLDIFNAGIYSYDCNSEKVDTLLTFELPNMMPQNYWADINLFYEHQHEYDWIMDFFADDKGILIVYVVSGKAFFSYLDYNGTIIESGLCKGWIPKAFNTIDGNYVIPISTEQYYDFIPSKVHPNEFKPDPEGNSILVNCRLSPNK